MVEPESPNRTALVADDDSLIRRVVAQALRLDGWAVLEAADGEGALASADRDDVSLCIMDRWMPGPSLQDRLTILTARHPQLALVVLTGGDLEDLDGVVTLRKPVKLDTLRAGIDRALSIVGQATPQ